jgi:hypothetical protein
MTGAILGGRSSAVDLSVVIGFRDWGLDRLATALQAHALSPFYDRIEVIVSDYGSSDPEAVRQVSEAGAARYCRTDVDGPWNRSRALNAGINVAAGSALVTTDCDVLFTPGLHQTVHDLLSADPATVQLLQCRDLPRHVPVIGAKTFDWTTLEQESVFRPRWGMGGMIAFSRDAYELIGGYDDRMHTWGGEDKDFANRLRWSGHRTSWIDDPALRIYHIWHESSSGAATASAEGTAAIEHNKGITLNDRTVFRRPRTRRSTPAATVCVATRNRSAYLQQCIDSILFQRFENFELLILDDGSTDETRDVVASVRDPRIRYLQADASEGVAVARNRLVAEAASPYVVIHDDDDLMLPWRLDAHFSALEPGRHGSYGGWIDFDESSGELSVETGKAMESAALLFTGKVLAHGTLMVRTDVLRRFAYNQDMLAGSDYNLVLRMTHSGVILAHTGEFHILRRLHGGNLTHTLSDHQKESSRRTTNLLRRRYDKTQEVEGRARARALKPVACRGQDELDAIARPYLPDRLTTRQVMISGLRGSDFEESRRLLEEGGARCAARLSLSENGVLGNETLHARGVTWPQLIQLRALEATLDVHRDAGDGSQDDDVEATEPHADAIISTFLQRLIADGGTPAGIVSLAYGPATAELAQSLWASDDGYRDLALVGWRQYAGVVHHHHDVTEALDRVSVLRSTPDADVVLVDLTDKALRLRLAPVGGP